MVLPAYLTGVLWEVKTRVVTGLGPPQPELLGPEVAWRDEVPEQSRPT